VVNQPDAEIFGKFRAASGACSGGFADRVRGEGVDRLSGTRRGWKTPAGSGCRRGVKPRSAMSPATGRRDCERACVGPAPEFMSSAFPTDRG
jgi:hypothetical protein